MGDEVGFGGLLWLQGGLTPPRHPRQPPEERPADISHQGQPAKAQRQGEWGGVDKVSEWVDHQASLSVSPQFSARLAEHSKQLAGVQNEYSFALVSASAHLEHYQRVELPAAMQVGDTQTFAQGALGGQGCSRGGMWQCWGGFHPLSPRHWTGTSTSGSGSICRSPAGQRWRPAGPPGTGSRVLWRHLHG